jgi:hypothetical protein
MSATVTVSRDSVQVLTLLVELRRRDPQLASQFEALLDGLVTLTHPRRNRR